MPEISRAELYALVWSTPMSRLTPKLRVSDVAIARACRRMNIPRPDVGYWTKDRLGKQSCFPPLPKEGGDASEWTLARKRSHVQRFSVDDAPSFVVDRMLGNEELASWLSWARLQAERLNPIDRLLVGETNELADEWKMGKVGTNPI
ncbi:MAG: hypothetical protein NXI30_15735 [bacterium]|nr:hypothetical protein [bacterium]